MTSMSARNVRGKRMTGKWETILAEDECAPDARHYFEESFRNITGERIHHFKMMAQRIESETGMAWERNGYRLSYDCTSPCYILEQEKKE